MASRLLTRRVLYLPNLRAAVNHFRAFSWSNDDTKLEDFKIVGETDSESCTIWPDNKLGPFGPQDKRFPMPGKIGTSLRHDKPAEITPTNSLRVEPEAIFEQLPSQRYLDVLGQVKEEAEYLEDVIGFEEESNTDKSLVPSADDMLECVAHECPQMIRKDFADLFPWIDITRGHLTIITISQKTKEDMSGWSLEVEEEREQLLESFVHGATEICEALQKAGYWADFIDPSCGKPYLSDHHTNASLYETDERYRKLGFEIDDLGCCKVVRHHIWGTKAYVGCLFTNAPTTVPILEMMVKN
ncbi:hypothetical protein ACF0H5_018896 [Mactra antiquata]